MSIEEVAVMTLDSIMCLFANRKLLESRGGGKGGVPSEPRAAAAMLEADEDGLYKGVSEDGKPMRARIGGKSVARKLIEAEKVKEEEEAKIAAQKKNKRGRRRGRKNRGS